MKQIEIDLKNEISQLLKDQEKLLSENEKSCNKNDQLKKCLQTVTIIFSFNFNVLIDGS